jgi:predicted transposase/invertase (TIGR01784 family)
VGYLLAHRYPINKILQEGLQEGLQKGRLEGKLEVARRLLQLEMSLSQVAQVTGLSEQDLQQILLG